MLAYTVIAAFYIRRSQARGVGTRVQPYVVAGIILALAMTGSLVWTLYHPLAFTLAGPGLFPALHSYPFAIGLALVVLAWAERNGALLDLAARLLDGRAGDRHRRLGQRPRGAWDSRCSS